MATKASAKGLYKLQSKIIIFPGFGAWRFLHINKKVSDEIKQKYAPKKAAGFGSIRVEITVGKTTWKSSIFPDKKSGTYLLPTKASVRRAEHILDDEPVSFTLRII